MKKSLRRAAPPARPTVPPVKPQALISAPIEAAKPQRSDLSFTPCSQKEIKERFKIEDEQATLEAYLKQSRAKLETIRTNIKRQISHPAFRAALTESLQDEQEEINLIRIYEEEIDSLKARLLAMRRTPEQLAARRGIQKKIAQGELACGETVIQLDKQLEALRTTIESIITQKQEMQRLAKEIDFASMDLFDTLPFLTLLNKLGESFHLKSEQKLRFLLGFVVRNPCVIRAHIEIFPESLTCAGIYRKGETAMLTAEETKRSEYDPPPVPAPWDMEESVKNAGKGNTGYFKVGNRNISILGMMP